MTTPNSNSKLLAAIVEASRKGLETNFSQDRDGILRVRVSTRHIPPLAQITTSNCIYRTHMENETEADAMVASLVTQGVLEVEKAIKDASEALQE